MDVAHDAKLDPALLALYRRKTLDVKLLRHRLRLAVPVDVFSTFQVDRGTQLLLRRMAAAGRSWPAALDLGCGYGPVCAALAKAGIARRVDAIDRDALAVAFARHNAEDNALPHVTPSGGIAYDGVAGRKYDAIACNLPAKAGPTVHRLLLLGAFGHLRGDGEVWIVAVEPLTDRIDQILSTAAVRLREKFPQKGHVVYGYSFARAPELPEQPYVRGRERFRWKGREYELTALHGLGEFDSRSWATDAVLEAFVQTCRRRAIRRLVACNPGQGHLAVLARRIAPTIEDITLVSRDRIALGASQANLRADGYGGSLRAAHTASFRGGPADAETDAVLAVLREKEGLDVNVEKLCRLRAAEPTCAILAGCKSAFGSRLVQALRRRGIRAAVRRRRKGCCAVTCE